MPVGVLSLTSRMLDADSVLTRWRWRGVRALCMGGAGRLALLTLVVTLGLSVSASAQSGALPPSNSSPPTISGTRATR